MGSSYIVQRIQQPSATRSQSQAFFFRQKQKNGHLDTQGSVFKLRSVHICSNVELLFFSIHRLPLATSREVSEPLFTSS